MIIAATTLFRWTDSSFAVTGWGIIALLILAGALSDIGNKRG